MHNNPYPSPTFPRRRALLLALAAAPAAALAQNSSNNNGGGRGDILVGRTTPLSGGMAPFMQPIHLGQEAAIDDFNAQVKRAAIIEQSEAR